jgi:hypothetical protein
MPSNEHSLTSSFLPNANREQQQKEVVVEMDEENYSIILNQHLPSMTHPNNLSMSTRFFQQQQQPLLFVAEETAETDHQNENDKLLLPRSTRSLKRRMSLLEKSRDWVIKFIVVEKKTNFILRHDVL